MTRGAGPKPGRVRSRPPEPAPHAPWPRGVVAALALALIVYVIHATLLRGFTTDDAFISYRYSRNIAGGLGPVYNPGEKVEGFSNPLFTFLLAGLYKLVPSVEWFPRAARLLGVLSGIGSLMVLSRLPAAGGVWSTALALLLTATSTSFALWSVGGLETTLYGLLILLGVAVTAARPRTARGQVGLGVLLAAITLSRPEGALPAAALWLARLVDPQTRRERGGHARVLVTAAIPVLLYLGFRVGYYGGWLPNTWLAKRMPAGMALERGLRYVWEFFSANGTALLYLAAPLALRTRGRQRVTIVAFGVIVLYLLHVPIVGGDWMDAHRFVAPVVPLLYFVVAEGWMALLGAAGAWIEARGAAGASAWVRPLGALVLWLALLVPNVDLTRREREAPYVNATPYYATRGRLVAAVAEPGWSVATDDIGAIGWYGGIRVIDMLGLVSRELATRATYVQALVAREVPGLIVLHYDDSARPAARWRRLKILDFDRIYMMPRGPVPVPGSLRARLDVLPGVERRLESLPAPLRVDLVALDAWLRTHQPDMRPVPAFPDP